MNCTRARMKEPKARVPKWYLKAIQKPVATGESRSFMPGDLLKYQTAQDAATTNTAIAINMALHQRVPKAKK